MSAGHDLCDCLQFELDQERCRPLLRGASAAKMKRQPPQPARPEMTTTRVHEKVCIRRFDVSM